MAENECDRMKLSERPINPLKSWHGVVEKVWPTCCWVRVVDEGYEDCEEMISFYQIIDIEGELEHGVPTR
jgi:hypothetical protein